MDNAPKVIVPETLTWEQFVGTYKPQQNHILPVDEEAPCDGLLYETYGPEVEYVRSLASSADPAVNGRVWTMLDCDGRTYYTSGFHYVNRIGYLVCEVPVPDGVVIEFAEEDDRETVTLRLTLDVTYIQNGENVSELKEQLRLLANRASQEGLLSGDLMAEVEAWQVDVVEVPTLTTRESESPETASPAA